MSFETKFKNTLEKVQNVEYFKNHKTKSKKDWYVTWSMNGVDLIDPLYKPLLLREIKGRWSKHQLIQFLTGVDDLDPKSESGSKILYVVFYIEKDGYLPEISAFHYHYADGIDTFVTDNKIEAELELEKMAKITE